MNYNLKPKTEKILKEKKLEFTKANISDLDKIINLFEERTIWFKEHKINQWSKYL